MGLSKFYSPKGNIKTLWKCRDREILCEGPAGTGKSRGALEKAYLYAIKYPGSRILICRKTRASMTNSTLVTMESFVIPSYVNIARSNRTSYAVPNGSEIVICGLDLAERVKSSEYDIIIVDEASEISLDDHEILLTRLRGPGQATYKQIILITNPSAPSHWINVRAESGMMTRIKTVHADNPTCSKEYLETLSRLTGHRRARLFEGLWCAAEGMIWDISSCLIDPEDPPSGEQYGAIDFGFSAPCAALCSTIYRDEAGQQIVYVHSEHYKSNSPLEVHASALQRMGNEDCVWFADPENPEGIRQLKKNGLAVTEATNRVLYGIDSVASMIESGRLFISKNCKELIKFVAGYVYSEDGIKPLKKEDHLPDALRYLCASLRDRNILEVNGGKETTQASI